MSAPAEFLQLQKNWIGRTIADRKLELKKAEENEDYEQCHEIKQTLDKGIAIAESTLQLDEEVMANPFSYVRLIFDTFRVFNDLTGDLEKHKEKSEGVEAYTFRYESHIYRTIKLDTVHPETKEEVTLAPEFMIENPVYPNCGAEEEGFIYIVEKICICGRKPATLHEIIDDIMLSCITMLEKQEELELRHLNPIR